MLQTIKNVMIILNEEWGDKFIISDSKIKVWMECLKDFDKETVLAASMHCVSTGGAFPPVIGQIRKECVDIKFGEMSPTPAPDAWVYVLEQIQGAGGSFSGLSELTREALRSVGTIFDLKRSENIAIERGAFIRAYNSIVEKRQKERVMLPTVKAMNAQNERQLPEAEPDKEPLALESHESADKRIPTKEEVQAMTQGVIDMCSMPVGRKDTQ